MLLPQRGLYSPQHPAFEVFAPPRLVGGKRGRYQFRHVADLFQHRTLADAYTLLPYYQHNFELELAIFDPTGKQKVIELGFRQPAGEDVLREKITELVKESLEKRDGRLQKVGNLNQLDTLVRLHWHLHALFRPWISKVRAEKPRGDDKEAAIHTAANLWHLWLQNPTGDGARARQLDEGREVAPVDAFEELLKQIRGPFIGFQT